MELNTEHWTLREGLSASWMSRGWSSPWPRLLGFPEWFQKSSEQGNLSQESCLPVHTQGRSQKSVHSCNVVTAICCVFRRGCHVSLGKMTSLAQSQTMVQGGCHDTPGWCSPKHLCGLSNFFTSPNLCFLLWMAGESFQATFSNTLCLTPQRRRDQMF